ncbi:MAG: hypothetical protein IJS59_08730 [Bacteroidaceae bacterium]|nr:hypothetical protein [Bacteroidaceae bacterium]
MKKYSFIAVAFAAMAFAACTGKQGAQSDTDAQKDSLRIFEQEQIEASIKLNLDSLAAEIGRLQNLPVVQKDGALQLTDEEKQVKPDYLLDPAAAENAMTLAEQYRLLAAMNVDKAVAALYDMPVDDYVKAIAKLLAAINDPSFKTVDSEAAINESAQALYEAMEQNGRINYFWQIVTASLVEQFYIVSQNTEKFLASFDDDAASEISLRLVLIQDAISRLTEYDANLLPVADALEPLYGINAVTVDELKAQIEQCKEDIALSRKSLISNF